MRAWRAFLACVALALLCLASCQPSSHAVVMNDFIKWFDEHGGLRRVAMMWYPAMGFGFEATQDLEPGDFALRVPLRMQARAAPLLAFRS